MKLLMKLFNHDTCHLSRLWCQKMADDKDANAFMLLYFLTAKQHKSWPYESPLVTRQVSNLLVVHFICRLSLETKPRPKSWPTLSIVWLLLKSSVLLQPLQQHWPGCFPQVHDPIISAEEMPRESEVSACCCLASAASKSSCLQAAQLQPLPGPHTRPSQQLHVSTRWPQ